MILHDLPRSARAGKLHVFAALALFVVGCTQTAPGELEVNVGQNADGSGGSGGSAAVTTAGAGGDPVSGGVTSSTTGAATSSSTGGVTPQQATFQVSLDTASPKIDLDDALEMTVTISPKGYVGSVSLAINNLGNGGITGDFAAKKITLDGSADVMVKLTLTTMSSTPPGDVAFSVSGTVATGAKTTAATLTVKPAITIVIPKNVYGLGGTQNNPYKMAFGDYPMNVIAAGDISDQHPLTVRFYNDDDISHEIHAANQAQGFPHDAGGIAPHSMDSLVRKINAKGLYDYYLHDQNAPATIGRLAVQ
ncbi:MAG: hypothetical protein ABJE95_33050 [Byssovorax sp.]